MDAEKEMEEYAQTRMSPKRRLLGKIARYAFRLAVFFIIGLVLWRVLFSDRVPSAAKTLLVNEQTYAAYESQGNKLTMYTQAQEQLTYREDEDGITGLFWVLQSVFIPEAQQIQLLTRYNNSTLQHIKDDFGLTVLPDRDEAIADVSLVVITDPSPTDRQNGDEQTTRYHASAAPTKHQTSMYNYRKYLFDGVVIDPKTTVEVRVDFYYAERVDYTIEPYAALRIYDNLSENESVKLTSRDKRALTAYRDGLS